MKKVKFALSGLIAVSFILFVKVSIEKADCSDLPDRIIFNHQLHITEMEIACENCHQNVEKSGKSDDRLTSLMQSCAECHDVENKDECAVCHTNPDKVIPYQGFHPNYEVFSHSGHLGAGYDCLSCHGQILKSTELVPGTTYLPQMTDCLDCHRKEGQTLDCASCHYGKHPLPGDYNVLEWTRTHGLEAAFDREYFLKYFEEGYCEDCHQGLNLNGEVHQPGWLFIHGDEAAAGGECLVCHEDRSKCAECHRSMLPIPHPLGDPLFANPVNGGEHTSDARAFFEACLSCHEMGSTSPTCVRCH